MALPADQLRMTVYTSLMAALIAAGAFIAIPLGPVPITMQNLFILLAGLLLGRNWGLACVAVYLLAGGLGLPVFSAGRGGFAHFAGPTGGYLIGYLVAVFAVGSIADVTAHRFREQSPQRFGIELFAAVLGTFLIYAVGVPWLKLAANLPWKTAVSVGALPFLIGDILKLVAAVIVARIARPLMKRSLASGSVQPG